MRTDHPLTLTVEQAAKVLAIGRSTAYELVHTGDIPSLRLGRRIVVPAARLAGLLSADSAALAPTAPTPSQRPAEERPTRPPANEDAHARTLF